MEEKAGVCRVRMWKPPGAKGVSGEIFLAVAAAQIRIGRAGEKADGDCLLVFKFCLPGEEDRATQLRAGGESWGASEWWVGVGRSSQRTTPGAVGTRAVD